MGWDCDMHDEIKRRIEFLIEAAKYEVKKDQVVTYAMRVLSNHATIGRDAGSAEIKKHNKTVSQGAQNLLHSVDLTTFCKQTINEHPKPILATWEWLRENAEHLSVEEVWNEFVTPTEEYQFHLWFPDVAMQMNKSNKPLLVIPSLYCLNQQEVKSKYGISENSAHGAKRGEEYHFGEYSNFKAWKRRWGWDYENVKSTFPIDIYKGTLLYDYYNHDNNNGPLKNYEL